MVLESLHCYGISVSYYKKVPKFFDSHYRKYLEEGGIEKLMPNFKFKGKL